MVEKLSSKFIEADVIIVGAGMSGIACAEVLTKKGIKCIILEARNRIGGRICTYKGFKEKFSEGKPQETIAVDVGASFIHGANLKNPLYKKLVKLDLKIRRYNRGYQRPIFYQDGNEIHKIIKEADVDKIDNFFNTLMHKVGELAYNICDTRHPLYSKREQLSVLNGINYILAHNNFEEFEVIFEEIVKDAPSLHYWNYLLWCFEEYEGIEFDQQGLSTFQKEKSYPGGNCCVEDGYISMLDAMSLGLDIRCNQKVIEINNYLTSSISINTSTGGHFIGKRVLVTVPLGVLKAKSIKFVPDLPEKKQNAINVLSMGSMDKVAIQFEAPFWDKKLGRLISISENKGEYPWIDVVDTPSAVLMAWTACSYGKLSEEKSDEEILRQILGQLGKIYGDKVTPVIGYYITRWNQDEFSQGAWSVKNMGASFQDNADLSEPVGNLFFSGEAASNECPGTVTAAYITGIAESERISNSL